METIEKKVCAICKQEIQSESDATVCDKCGTTYHKTCLTNVGRCIHCKPNQESNNSAAEPTNTASNAVPVKKKFINKKRLLILLGAAVALLAVVLTVILLVGGKKDFTDMFGHLHDGTVCVVKENYIKLDSDPLNLDFDDATYDELIAWENNDHLFTEKAEEINAALGFPYVIVERFGTTAKADGRQTESNDKYTVSWTYNPDLGVEVIYEIKK